MKNNRSIKKSDLYVIKWLTAICKKQIPMIAFIVFVNVVHGVTSVAFANFSKRVIDGATEYKSQQSDNINCSR